MKTDVLVVGGGAAGIIAAWRAASFGAKVTILEKTNRLGTKILVSGGGKCNITHDGSIESVLKSFRPEEARFLRPACYRFTNHQIVEMLTSRGLRVMTREDGRIFPVDQTAKDVVAILAEYLVEVGVDVRMDTPVSQILTEGNRIVGAAARYAPTRVRSSEPTAESSYRPATAKNLLRDLGVAVEIRKAEDQVWEADAVIVCPGGSSYPNSGTTGDGFGWARELGHTVNRVRAALAPIYLSLSEGDQERSGVALRDIVLKARQGKEIARWRGDLLFTHQGVSGPTVLAISRIVEERLPEGDVTLEVDCRPDETFEELTGALQNLQTNHPRRLVRSFIAEIVPDRLVAEICRAIGIDDNTPFARFERKSRNALVAALKGWNLGPVRHVPLEKGEVVAGGIALNEVNPQTMESALVPGLFLCGEVLDIAGPVGGYNLQAAFATGFVAGESAAKRVRG